MKMPLYRGILLMGATSIIGGTVFGLYTTGQKPAIPEGGLLILLARFYVWSWIKSLTAH
jgi:hypothetical protein